MAALIGDHEPFESCYSVSNEATHNVLFQNPPF